MSGVLASRDAVRIAFDGSDDSAIIRPLAVEEPVAFEINGLAYAVMLATPCDLEDYALGFVLSEGLAAMPSDVTASDIAQIKGGHVIRMTIPSLGEELAERVRLRVTEGACGLCGTRSIEELLKPPSMLTVPPAAITSAAIAAALAALPDFQPMGAATGAMHAAAFCSADGAIILAREDTGRHNALDKLVGAMARASVDPASGFIILSARCSFELVEKTLRCGCPMLVTISAPTALSVERAEAGGLTLIALARPDNALLMNNPHGLFKERKDV